LRGEPSGGRAAQAPASVPVSSPRASAPPIRPIDPALATQLQRYSTEEVQEILARAVERQEAQRGDSLQAGSQASPRLAFDDLVAAAREVGVDPEVLRAASRELREKQQAQQGLGTELDAWRRRKKNRFYRHLG